MSRPVAIRAESLGKQYRLGTAERYRTLRDSLSRLARGAFLRREKLETFWAVNDVSFEISAGEVVGIIGRNGAGKSTLLKLLARITEPTRGRATIHGRVGALLEVGTGFHPELSGRENVFLNGAVLGMKRNEIARKFDEIVAFAEVEKFIDTPVKHYSSGMYLRLAFAVAAHLEPEVLIVDEVLAVGDARFQRKCMEKMEDVGQHGRTVLFVSHNMPAVTRICPRTILLDGGKVLRDGPSAEVVGAYLHAGLGTTAAREWSEPAKAPGDEVARLRAVRARDVSGEVSNAMDIRRPVAVEIEYDVLEAGHVLAANFVAVNDEGVMIFHSSDPERTVRPVGRNVSRAVIPGNFLAEGSLVIHAALTTPEPVRLHFYERDAIAFQVVDTMEGDSVRGNYAGPMYGVVRPMLKWETEKLT